MKFNFKITIPRPFKLIQKFFTPEDTAGKKSLEELKHTLRTTFAFIVFGSSWQMVSNHNEWYHWIIFVAGTWAAMYGIDRSYKLRAERLDVIEWEGITEIFEKEEKQGESN